MFLRAQQTNNRICKISNKLLTTILSTEDSDRKHRLKLVFCLKDIHITILIVFKKSFVKIDQRPYSLHSHYIRKISNELLTTILSTEDSDCKHRLKLVFCLKDINITILIVLKKKGFVKIDQRPYSLHSHYIRKISNELLTTILSTEDSDCKHRLKLVFCLKDINITILIVFKKKVL